MGAGITENIAYAAEDNKPAIYNAELLSLMV